MSRPLHILFLEDSVYDLKLMERELIYDGLVYLARRVETRADFLQQLTEFSPDLILADYHLPQFDGVSALLLTQELAPLTPVIIVTGGLNEEIAVNCMKMGAADYVLKEHLSRLVPSINSALDKKHILVEKRQAEATLRQSEQQYRFLIEHIADGIGILQHGKLVFVNDALAAMLGIEAEHLMGKSPLEILQQDYQAEFEDMLAHFTHEQSDLKPRSILQCLVTSEKREIWIEGYYSVIIWQGAPALLINLHDITKHKVRGITIQQERDRLLHENLTLRATMKDRYRLGEVIGRSPAMQPVYEMIIKAAASEKDVVICGESGTGKELVAHTIHQLSSRQQQTFVPVNCGAVPESLFESEFFGYCKGAFTGADRNKQGLFAATHKGTLFLDEVEELTPTMQVKLLRVLENGEYTPIGERMPRKANVRIIAATNRPLHELVEQGLMREDFFYRIHVIVITVPPLRERREDIPLLLEHFLAQFNPGNPPSAIPGNILDSLYHHDWPGNIRQLRNTLYRYLTVGATDFIGFRLREIEEQKKQRVIQNGQGLRDVIAGVEKDMILQTLELCRWNRGQTAEVLHIDPKTLYRKLKQYNVT